MKEDYYDGDEAVGVAAPDPRIALVQEIVDMEQHLHAMQREGDQLAKKCAALSMKIGQSRKELAQRMGWDASPQDADADNIKAELIKRKFAQ